MKRSSKGRVVHGWLACASIATLFTSSLSLAAEAPEYKIERCCQICPQALQDSSYTVASVDQDPDQQLNADYLSSELTANQIDEEGEPHSNCRYTLRDSIGRFPAYPDGLSFDYNSVTGAVTRNFQ